MVVGYTYSYLTPIQTKEKILQIFYTFLPRINIWYLSILVDYDYANLHAMVHVEFWTYSFVLDVSYNYKIYF